MPKQAYQLRRDVLLSNIVEECPKAAELLSEYGLHCVSCFASAYDTLETGAKIHGISDEELDEMIGEINTELAKDTKT